MATLAATGTWTALRNVAHGMAGGDTVQDARGMGNIPEFRNVLGNASGTSITGEFAVIPDELMQYLGLMATNLNLHFWQAFAITMRHLQALQSFGAPGQRDETGVFAPVAGGTAL